MATIGQLRAQIKFYLQKDNLEEGSQDILLDELNEARLSAELQHDWKHSLVRVTLSVDPDSGGALSSVTGLPTGRRVKSPEGFYLVTSGGDVPLFHSSKRSISERRKATLHKQLWDYDTRFRSDDSSGIYTNTQPQVYLLGETVYLDPKPTTAQSLAIDVYTFLAEYDCDDDSDWFTINAPGYLKWAAIVALNHKTGTFAPRQEGVLPPPEKYRNEKFAEAVKMDNYFYNTGRTILM